MDERGRSRDRNVRISSLGHLDSFTEDYRTAPSAQTYRPKSRNRSINRNHRGHQQSLGYEERDNDGDYWEFDLNEPMDNSVLQFHQQFTYADNGFFQVILSMGKFKTYSSADFSHPTFLKKKVFSQKVVHKYFIIF